MGRLSKVQEKAHDDALALASLTRRLKDEEVEFVFRNYQPMATHRVAQGAIFFTPYEMASDFAVMARLNCGGRVIDYAAGIGVLTHHMVLMERWDSRDEAKQHVCVEIEPEFVELGKKLVPEAEWVSGNIFDREFMQSLGTFKMGIANPPFGSNPSLKSAKSWMKAKLPAHLATVELMLRMCELGGFAIIPRVDQEYQPDRVGSLSQNLTRLYTAFPGLRVFMCLELDHGLYPRFSGANPDAVIVDVSTDDMTIPLPIGFDDVAPSRTPAQAQVCQPLSAPLPRSQPMLTQGTLF